MRETYEQFLHDKMALAQETGFEVGLEEINPMLKPHQKLAVQWAIRWSFFPGFAQTPNQTIKAIKTRNKRMYFIDFIFIRISLQP